MTVPRNTKMWPSSFCSRKEEADTEDVEDGGGFFRVGKSAFTFFSPKNARSFPKVANPGEDEEQQY